MKGKRKRLFLLDSLPSSFVRYEAAGQFGASTPILLQSKRYNCGHKEGGGTLSRLMQMGMAKCFEEQKVEFK